MDINLVRLRLPLSASAAQVLATALTSGRYRFEQSLAHLSSRTLSSDPELVRRHQKPGLPFVFTIPENRAMSCLLMGPAITALPAVLTSITAIAQLPFSGPVTALDYQAEPVHVSTDGEGELPVLSAVELLELAVPRYAGCTRLRVELLTPLRLVRDGRELSCFDPVRFVCTVLRRISALAAYYGTAGDPELFVRLAAVAGTITVAQSRPCQYSSGQRGVTGTFELLGAFEELGPLLEFGGMLHLGKGASFGMGCFRITPLS